jgi:hypothetical protein
VYIFFLEGGRFVVKDVLYLWTFCGRTFCRGGRFVLVDDLWKNVLWKDVMWKDVL